jgi:hypothetical protein
LQLPALTKLLGRASATACSAETLEEMLCSAFEARAVAPVRAAADGLKVDEGWWLCADPVHMQLQHAQVLLMPDVVPEAEEAQAMCFVLNGHFAGTGLRFHAPHPRRWYVQVDAEPRLTTTPLRRAVWDDAKTHQPRGDDAVRWQRILTEIQMLLYAHPSNQARETQGELPISSLWLWGEGKAAPLRKAYAVVGGGGLAGAFAEVSGAAQCDSLSQMLEGNFSTGLWACEAPGLALDRGELYAWRQAVQRVEQEVALPMLKELRAGALKRLTVEVPQDGAARCFELTPHDVWKFWRRARPLADYAV